MRAFPGSSRCARWLGVLAWLLLLPRPAAQARDTALADAVKAAYLYKFAPFVAWPGGAAYPSGAFTICIAGDGRIGPVLSRMVGGQSIGGHPIAVRPWNDGPGPQGCSELYARGRPEQVAAVLAAVRGLPVLTVTDDARIPAATGMVDFVLRDGHVRFAIDNAAATAAGLSVSSKLLSLAVRVTEPRP